MSHKKKRNGPAPVPPGNRSPMGPGSGMNPSEQNMHPNAKPDSAFEEQDPKRRLGDYMGAGEQSIKQPGGLNDANH